MTSAEIRAARQTLGLTQAQFGFMLETTTVSACCFEMAETTHSWRPLPVRAEQLINAWLAGYRPPCWPV